MHVTACLAGQNVDVEVGESCRTIQALKEAIVKELPQLCVEGFDVSVGGHALDDEGVVSLTDSLGLDVSANARGLSVLALRESGCEVSEAGLFKAVREGDAPLCTLYLDAGMPIDCVDAGRNTPLHFACRRGHVEIAALLLNRGSNAIDEKNGGGSTPLFLACAMGWFELAALLLDRGSTAIDEKDGCDTPLHLACHGGDLELATLLLDRGSTAIDEKDGFGSTPLLLACDEGHLEVATLLLKRGSNAIDEKNVHGHTPLFLACDRGRQGLELATLLLDRGSTAIDEKDEDGEYGKGDTPLLLACDRGSLELVTLLLDRGSTAIDEKNGYGDTPLLLACDKGHLEIATLLLDRGCSFDVEAFRIGAPYPQEVLLRRLLSERGHDVLPDAKRRRIGEQ